MGKNIYSYLSIRLTNILDKHFQHSEFQYYAKYNLPKRNLKHLKTLNAVEPMVTEYVCI